MEKEIKPFVEEWEEAEEFPRELYRRAGELGILGVGYPEEWGGFESDVFHEVVVTEELTRSGSGGIAAGLMSHSIALPPILALGTPEQKERFIRPVLRGEKIAALGITEPGGGSDVAISGPERYLILSHRVVTIRRLCLFQDQRKTVTSPAKIAFFSQLLSRTELAAEDGILPRKFQIIERHIVCSAQSK